MVLKKKIGVLAGSNRNNVGFLFSSLVTFFDDCSVCTPVIMFVFVFLSSIIPVVVYEKSIVSSSVRFLFFPSVPPGGFWGVQYLFILGSLGCYAVQVVLVLHSPNVSTCCCCCFVTVRK